MKKRDIIHTAIDNLEKTAGFHATWKDAVRGPFDGTLTINIRGIKHKFDTEIRKELRYYQIGDILDKPETGNPLIIVAAKIFPKIKEYLRENNVAYLEANGNMYIRKEDAIVWLDGNKPIKQTKDKINRAFTKTGIKTVFHFLLYEDLINYTHREIANTVEIGLGNINYILNGLKELGFLVKLNVNEYKLTDKKKLLEKWMEAYREKLQPDLKIGTFRFLKEEDFVNWRNIPLQNMKTWWGGEPAGDMLTNHLRPEELTLYTLETRQELMKHYRLVPDETGNIKVYNKFWNIDNVNLDIVPPLLIYTDLINKNDKRCTEIAEIIYDEHIKENI
ncbi:MAG: type IV toxin-antitoxin system AbiEi family antitoxin [Bacteroidales bacterium]|nr:type IV toxin-antitoxin system AbiEi family antitoxin [Bacteroidales bacterium]